MEPNLKLLDKIQLTGHIQTNFATTISQDDRILIASETGLYILTQKPNLSCSFPEYMCHKYYLKPSTYAICEDVDLDINTFISNVPRDALYESMCRVELSQGLKDFAAPVIPAVLQAEWSQAGMVDNECMLATLTNLYSLELYVKSTYESGAVRYKMIVNLTKETTEMRREKFTNSTKFPAMQKLRELKKRVEGIAPISFTWSHVYKYDNQTCSMIFTGHFAGDISVWRIYSISHKAEFITRFSTNLNNITSLYWHTTANGGALCVGDKDGRISVIKLSELNQKQCVIGDHVTFFNVVDRQVDKILVTTHEGTTFLIAIKQCYLIIYGLNLAGDVFDSTVHCVDNYYISGVHPRGNILIVLTLTGVIKQLTIQVKANKIVIEDNIIPVKFDFPGYKTHGFTLSPSKVLYGVLLSSNRLKNSIKGKRFIHFCVFHDANLNPLSLLMDNPTESLRTYWDCFEALRMICLRDKRFPWLGLSPDLDLDGLSFIKLKTLRLIAKLSECVFNVIKRVTSYDIKPYIILHYLVEIKLIMGRLATLLNKPGRTMFELQSMDLQLFHLKELIVSGILAKAQVGKTFINELTHLLSIANEIKFPDPIKCNFCGEKLLGSTCLPPHADSRCIFTMMPISFVAAFKCRICQSLASFEGVDGEAICPYCDFHMERICLSDKVQDLMMDIVESECASDCVKDNEDTKLFEELDDNDLVVVNVSDDEDQSHDNKLLDIYSKLDSLAVRDELGKETVDLIDS